MAGRRLREGGRERDRGSAGEHVGNLYDWFCFRSGARNDRNFNMCGMVRRDNENYREEKEKPLMLAHQTAERKL